MKRIDLGAVAATPLTARAKHPTVEADADTSALLEQFAVINPQYKALKNQSETLSKQLGAKIKTLFFNRFAGVTPESSTMLVLAGGRTIKLTLKEAYSKQCTKEEGIVNAIGQEKADKYFRFATVLKLDLDMAPDDKQETFATGVIALAKKLGLDSVVTATQCIQPVAGFHEARTTILTTEENLKLDAVIPVVAYPQL